MTEVLSRETAIKNNTDPMGNTWDVVVCKTYPGLFRIQQRDGHALGQPPAALRGHYTNKDRANAAIHAHLVTMWDKSDEAAKRAKSAKKESVEEK
jgi:hypothetical protein